jgi:hypothetical protein
MCNWCDSEAKDVVVGYEKTTGKQEIHLCKSCNEKRNAWPLGYWQWIEGSLDIGRNIGPVRPQSLCDGGLGVVYTEIETVQMVRASLLLVVMSSKVRRAALKELRENGVLTRANEAYKPFLSARIITPNGVFMYKPKVLIKAISILE